VELPLAAAPLAEVVPVEAALAAVAVLAAARLTVTVAGLLVVAEDPEAPQPAAMSAVSASDSTGAQRAPERTHPDRRMAVTEGEGRRRTRGDM
jgi:hypothetical protein